MKIPCIVLVFYNFDIIKDTMEFLSKYGDRLEFTVIENRSIHTDFVIRPYMERLLQEGVISRYVLFGENITSNAVEMLIDNDIVPELHGSEYFMLTDGDLIVNNGDFLSEQLAIMNNNRDVFICGTRLNLDNLPLNNYPHAASWIPPVRHVYPDYYEGVTGMHLALIRTADFFDYFAFIKRHHVTHQDIQMHHYCYHLANKKWARTKHCEAIHLTWYINSDSNHPYEQWKSKQNIQQLWAHNWYCSFEVMTKHSYKKYER